MYIYNTQSEKNTVFDSVMVTTLKLNNVPGLFLAKQCPLLERGTTLEPHTPVSALLEICIAKRIHLHY